MWSRLRSKLNKFLPTHIGNPFGLAYRMISSGNRAAFFTLLVTALGVLCIPLDLLLSLRERRYIAVAGSTPARPTIFICGPARSGTTLVFQILCRYLDVTYLQNITAMFPRSPITATTIYRKLAGWKRTSDDFRNYYGKTSGMDGPSEANHVWNRWVEPDATGFRTRLTDDRARDAARFFAAFSNIDCRSVLAKNNNMNVFADRIAAAMPSSVFICLRRDPVFLAQSLLQARREIRGSVTDGYGVEDTDNFEGDGDPVASVCAQVNYLNRRAEVMRSNIGDDRFWIVDYEEFCNNPQALVAKVASRLNIPIVTASSESEVKPIAVHNVVRNPSEVDRIRDILGRES